LSVIERKVNECPGRLVDYDVRLVASIRGRGLSLVPDQIAADGKEHGE
jgi:hypothetical protein